MRKLPILLSLLLSLLMALPFAQANTPATETTVHSQYSTDSDGVQSRTMKVTDESSDRPLTYTLYYTRLGQKYQSDINEYTFLLKWSRPLASEANLTFWTGYLKNDIRHFMPAAIMYDKSLSDTEHFWLSAGRETIGTIPANRQGLFRNSLTASYQWKTAPGTYVNLSRDYWFYSDQNREQKWLLSNEKQLSERFALTMMYSYHDAKFKRSGIYWVPQKEHVVSIMPRYTVPVGQGNLILSAKKSLWAHNSDGSMNQYELGVYYQIGNFTTGCSYLKDGNYSSHTYTLDYQLFW